MHGDGSDDTAGGAGGRSGTPVGDPVSLWTLLEAVGDHRLVHALTRDVVTFEQLAATSWSDTVARVGVWAARLRLPATPGPLPDLAGAVPVSRYVPGPYPAGLLDLPDPPVLLTVAGAADLLGGAHVTVGGTRHPSAGGRVAARAAAVAAAHVGVSVVAVADGGAGTVALEQCAALSHPAVMVATHDPTVTGVDGRLAAAVVGVGGCVVAVAMPEHDPVGQARRRRRPHPRKRSKQNLAPRQNPPRLS